MFIYPSSIIVTAMPTNLSVTLFFFGFFVRNMNAKNSNPLLSQELED